MKILSNKYFSLLVVVVICIGLAVGQKTFSGPSGTSGTTLSYSGVNEVSLVLPEDYQTPNAERNVLLVVNVQEPCYQCGGTFVTTAATAASWTQSFPTTSTQHSYWFKTIGTALAKAEKENWEVTYLAVTRSMPFETKSVEEHVKQPDVVTTKRHYMLKESQ